jgi:hypothetical protein
VWRSAKRFFGAKFKHTILPNFRSLIESRAGILGAFVSPAAQKNGLAPVSRRCSHPAVWRGD